MSSGLLLLQSELYIWKKHRSISDQIQVVRAFGFTRVYNGVFTRVPGQKVTQRNSRFYTTSNYDFDEFGYPRKSIEGTYTTSPAYTADPQSEQDQLPTIGVGRTSSERFISRNYKHLEPNWVLGLMESHTLHESSSVLSSGLTSYSYDSKGNQLSVDRYGDVSEYEYDSHGHMEEELEPNGNHIEYSAYVVGVPGAIKRSWEYAGSAIAYPDREIDRNSGTVDSSADARLRNVSTSYRHYVQKLMCI